MITSFVIPLLLFVIILLLLMVLMFLAKISKLLSDIHHFQDNVSYQITEIMQRYRDYG